jgi:type I restriction enzyme S subunit
MSSKEWKTYKLGEICVIKGGKRLPKGEPYSLNTTKYPYIRLVDVENGKVSKNNIQYLNEKTQSLISRYIVEDGDVCLAIVGNTIGVVFYIDEQLHGANLTENAARLTLFKDTYSKYVYYFLLSQEGQNEIYKNAIGSAQGKLPIYGIQNIDIPLPKYSTQIKVGNILSSLDDKIELNRQTNQTLEGIAQTLFQEMCVPKGEELPEGWRVGKLEEVLEIKYGKDHKHLEVGLIPVYGSGGIMRYANKALYEHESILIPRKGTLSNLFYINKPFWSVDTMFYTKIKNKTYGKFLFLLLKTMNLASMNVGSAVPSLTTQVLNNIEIILPSDATIEKFDDIVTPMFTTIESNEQENQTLIALRDSLLPKLMKGEIEI